LDQLQNTDLANQLVGMRCHREVQRSHPKKVEKSLLHAKGSRQQYNSHGFGAADERKQVTRH
jgi:hypothetical protein